MVLRSGDLFFGGGLAGGGLALLFLGLSDGSFQRGAGAGESRGGWDDVGNWGIGFGEEGCGRFQQRADYVRG